MEAISVMRVFFRTLAILMLQIFLLSGCAQNVAEEPKLDSFTSKDIYSYDKKYVAEQTVIEEDSTQVSYVKVSIIDTGNKKEVFSFIPARARDFWGICWESDSYNIWIQSGDIGVICYKCEDEIWVQDESAIRPDDIVSKYD